MLWAYELKAFAEKLNLIKVDDDGITLMEKFTGKTAYITLKNHHTWGCTVYVMDSGFQGNKSIIPKWETLSRSGIYLGHSQFNAVSVALLLNVANSHVSPQFHMVFDNEFSTVKFMS